MPPEERTQFISREALRNSLGPNTAPPSPPPSWPAPGGAPQPGGWQRASQPPPRTPEMLPREPAPPSGPRPPEWDWSQGTGGAELRSEQISAAELNAPRKTPSSRGWRKWLYYGSFKLINTGESPDEQLLRNLNATVAGHLRGTYSVVVLGGKGGVGKTTTTASIGSTFAALRKDKVIAIDANPDRASNLADRIDPKATNSYQDVLSDRNLHGYSDIRSHVGMNEAAGLDVLGNRYQPDRQPLTAKVYTDTHAVLQRFYSVLISDSGTDVDHPVIPGLMSRADALIMVASTAPDGAKGAAELMDWAYEAGYHRLLQRTVVVINDVRGETGKAHRKLVDSLVEKFSRWVSPQRVFVVPFDPHIASAGVIDINELRPETRRRYLEITARLASGFNSTEGAQ
ncbi:MinD/ParA family ATP-binding protein [Mycolicibacterium goodii]|uniref:MinD/ParA family ATP-binding protein n=1 Tax=Mycolicibacterium goodii TaxID=134601 RepID=UPI0027DFCA07|nr:MinD/ParA family protein [Mycolicibacterium goodii]